MNKSELISDMASKSGLTKKQAESALDAFIQSVGAALRKRDDVRLTGFGTFLTTERPATTMRNPQTREMISVGPSIVPRFRAGSTLKDTVKGKTVAAPKKVAARR